MPIVDAIFGCWVIEVAFAVGMVLESIAGSKEGWEAGCSSILRRANVEKDRFVPPVVVEG